MSKFKNLVSPANLVEMKSVSQIIYKVGIEKYSKVLTEARRIDEAGIEFAILTSDDETSILVGYEDVMKAQEAIRK